MDVLSAINKATQFLKTKGITTSKLDSEILMSSVFKTDRADIILNSKKKL